MGDIPRHFYRVKELQVLWELNYKLQNLVPSRNGNIVGHLNEHIKCENILTAVYILIFEK